MLERGPQDTVSAHVKGRAKPAATWLYGPQLKKADQGWAKHGCHYQWAPPWSHCRGRERAEIDIWGCRAVGLETRRKPIRRGQGTGNTEEVSREGWGRGVRNILFFSFFWLHWVLVYTTHAKTLRRKTGRNGPSCEGEWKSWLKAQHSEN